jgi:myo-inositol 2-dehydrogenase / D-chiro-inositol 1-dehydrogenase
MRIGLAGAGRIGAFHARILSRLPGVDSVIVADADGARARQIAERLGIEACGSPEALLSSGLDALVVAAPTQAHPEFIVRGIEAGLPVFCEKPVAPDVESTLEVIKRVGDAATAVQVGFQRRFDHGYGMAREAVRSGALGWVHTLRATTLDATPPAPSYIQTSGGLFRDCGVHDFDAIRWVTGGSVREVYAVGANRGADFFRAAGDVDTMAAMLTLDDDSLAVVSSARYNGAGYDVRLEVLGSRDSICAGLDDRLPLRSAEPGATFPSSPGYPSFTDRFADAYRAELAAFLEFAEHGGHSPAAMSDALEAFYIAEACELSRARHEPVAVAEVRR